MKEKTSNQMPAVINFDYEGNPIGFTMDGVVMVNATEMAKPFDKRPVDWLKNQSTVEFLNELSVVRILTTEELIIVKQGGAVQGTWMHEDVALEFARWLAPRFAIWCNDRIKELLTKGQTSLYPTVMNPDNPLVNNYIKHINRSAFEHTKNPEINTTPDSVRIHLQKTEKDIYKSLRVFCEKKRLPLRNVITAAIEEKIHREIHPEKFDSASLLHEIDMKKQEIEYLNRLLEMKERACIEKLEIQFAMKQQEVDYLKQLLEVKNQVIEALQGK
jgi:hypothetical protein